MSARCRPLAFCICLFTLALFGGTPPALADSSPLEVAQGGTIMQCMERCIRAEGKAEKATCKSRCAHISSQPRKQKDCMGIYKSCQRSCGSSKQCQRGCKAKLMKCS